MLSYLDTGGSKSGGSARVQAAGKGERSTYNLDGRFALHVGAESDLLREGSEIIEPKTEKV
jgi:hypothetical protein